MSEVERDGFAEGDQAAYREGEVMNEDAAVPAAMADAKSVDALSRLSDEALPQLGAFLLARLERMAAGA